jgi:8-oxo-dGTP pyrophosphatase MutT (NUDIX family)
MCSVVLVRPTPGDKSDAYQVLLVERMARDGSQYLNAHVFPGGQIDATDNNDIRRAALRELYEEASIHLNPDQSSQHPRRVIPEDVEVNTSQIPFSQYLETQNGPSAESSLIPLARWITPKLLRKRFDTHFLLALSSSSNSPVNGKVDGQEIKSLAWFSPLEALNRFSEGKITLFPPQWYLPPFFVLTWRAYPFRTKDVVTDLFRLA